MSLSYAVSAPTLGTEIFSAVSPDSRHLLALEGMTRRELLGWLADATAERDWLRRREPNRDDLAGAVVMLAFIENSTRTRVSFEIAARRLGGVAVYFGAEGSSFAKGESLLDTTRLFAAMGADLLVIRHSASGSASYLAKHLDLGVINAGDGQHEHPTQGLLDLMSLSDAWGGRFEGRRLAIVGDITHSRVARSAIHGARTLGARIVVSGPGTLLPPDIERLGCTIAPSVEEAMSGADAVMALRLQRERMDKGLLPSLGEYSRVWGIDARRVALMQPDAVVLHPGPVNRGLEIAPDVADSKRSRILDQVENGVAVRCAVLCRCFAAARAAAHA